MSKPESSAAEGPEVDIEAIESRLDGVSKAPWKSINVMGLPTVVVDDEISFGLTEEELPPLTDAQAGLDAIFIAHAREDVPALIARVRELEAVVARWRALGHHIRRDVHWQPTEAMVEILFGESDENMMLEDREYGLLYGNANITPFLKAAQAAGVPIPDDVKGLLI